VSRRLLVLATCVGLAGCAVSDPTQYYTLGPLPAPSGESRTSGSTPRSVATETGTGAVGIGVGPVIMPGYLDHSQIVIRTGAGQVELSTFYRWAEPLHDGIVRMLAEEIGARVPTDRIVTFPWRGFVARSLQYQVVLAVVQFDGRPGSDVTLDTRWRILGRDGDELVFRRSTVTEATTGAGYERLVAAMSRAVATLGGEIATEIRSMRR
jgi:uncharacterized protein